LRHPDGKPLPRPGQGEGRARFRYGFFSGRRDARGPRLAVPQRRGKRFLSVANVNFDCARCPHDADAELRSRRAEERAMAVRADGAKSHLVAAWILEDQLDVIEDIAPVVFPRIQATEAQHKLWLG